VAFLIFSCKRFFSESVSLILDSLDDDCAEPLAAKPDVLDFWPMI
jgi:hypothetical protein